MFFKKLDSEKAEVYKYVEELEQEIRQIRAFKSKAMSQERKQLVKELCLGSTLIDESETSKTTTP